MPAPLKAWKRARHSAVSRASVRAAVCVSPGTKAPASWAARFCSHRITSYNVCYTKLLRDDATATSQLTLTLSDAPVDGAKQVCIAISALRLKAETEPDDHLWQPLDLLATGDDDGCLPTGYQIPLDDNGDPRFLYLDLLHYV